MGMLSFIVFSPDAKIRRAVEERLEETGHATVTSRISDPRQLADVLRGNEAEAVYIDLGSDSAHLLDLIEKANPVRPVLLVGGPADDPFLILRAMRLGVREFFPSNETGGLLPRVIERLLSERVSADPAHGRERGRVLAVKGSKGGVGATFVTCQLALALQQLGRKVCVVDLNLQSGDVALQLDLKPQHTLSDLVRKEGEIDSIYMRTIAQPHASGLAIVAAPLGAEEAEAIEPRHVSAALQQLRFEFDLVLADVPRGWDAPSLAALDEADRVVLVTSLEVPALTHTREALRLLPRLGFSPEDLRVLVNRAGRTNPLTARELDEFLGRPADFQIPNDWEAASEAINQGKALGRMAAGARIETAFKGLAEGVLDWCGLAPETKESDRTPFVGRLRSHIQKVLHGTQ